MMQTKFITSQKADRSSPSAHQPTFNLCKITLAGAAVVTSASVGLAIYKNFKGQNSKDWPSTATVPGNKSTKLPDAALPTINLQLFIDDIKLESINYFHNVNNSFNSASKSILGSISSSKIDISLPIKVINFNDQIKYANIFFNEHYWNHIKGVSNEIDSIRNTLKDITFHSEKLEEMASADFSSIKPSDWEAELNFTRLKIPVLEKNISSLVAKLM